MRRHLAPRGLSLVFAGYCVGEPAQKLKLCPARINVQRCQNDTLALPKFMTLSREFRWEYCHY